MDLDIIYTVQLTMSVTINHTRVVTRVAPDLIFSNPDRARFGIADPAGSLGWSRMFLSWRPRLYHIT